MNSISKYLLYLLAFLLPFGSVNPFNLSAVADVSGSMSEQLGITPIVFILCSLISLLDSKIHKHFVRIKRYVWSLSSLIASLFFASLIYSETLDAFPTTYLLKLTAAIGGFFIIALYFMEYPQILKISMNIYAYTCVIIVAAYLMGFLNNYSFVSNGRLWIFGENPNSFSFLMSLGVLILVNKLVKYNKAYTPIKEMGPINRITDVVAIVVLFIYIMLSGSRGSFLIIIICMSIMLINKKMVSKAWIYIPLIIGAIVVGLFYYNSHKEDISLFTRLSNTESDERALLQKQTFSLFVDRPVIGWGVSGYKSEMRLRYNEGRDSHNVVITTMGMAGLIGSVSLCFFLFRIGRVCWKNRNNNMLALSLFVDILLMSMKTGGVLTFMAMWYGYAIISAMNVEKRK